MALVKARHRHQANRGHDTLCRQRLLAEQAGKVVPDGPVTLARRGFQTRAVPQS